MPSKSKLMAVGLLAVMLVAGFAAGAATTSYASSKNKRHRGGNERWSYSGMLQQELGLTDAERDSVRALVRLHRPEMRAVFASVQPRLDSIQSELRSEINAMLTPEQQQKFRDLTARMEAERAERMRSDSAKRD